MNEDLEKRKWPVLIQKVKLAAFRFYLIVSSRAEGDVKSTYLQFLA